MTFNVYKIFINTTPPLWGRESVFDGGFGEEMWQVNIVLGHCGGAFGPGWAGLSG